MQIHCFREKGKGYAPTEGADNKYHGVEKFELVSGQQVKGKSHASSYRQIFGDTLTAMTPQTEDRSDHRSEAGRHRT